MGLGSVLVPTCILTFGDITLFVWPRLTFWVATKFFRTNMRALFVHGCFWARKAYELFISSSPFWPRPQYLCFGAVLRLTFGGTGSILGGQSHFLGVGLCFGL